LGNPQKPAYFCKKNPNGTGFATISPEPFRFPEIATKVINNKISIFNEELEENARFRIHGYDSPA